MYIKEEGKYDASLIRKYRTEYKSKNLQGFCRDQKVSYNKMLHCLRNDSYRKPKTEAPQVKAEQGLHPLVIDNVAPWAPRTRTTNQVTTSGDLMLKDIELSLGARASLHIGSCSRASGTCPCATRRTSIYNIKGWLPFHIKM